MFAFSDEALWRADQKVPPDYRVEEEGFKEVDLDMAAKHIDATENLSQGLLCSVLRVVKVFRVFRVQHHEPEVTGEAEQARKSCRLWMHAGLLLWLRKAA